MQTTVSGSGLLEELFDVLSDAIYWVLPVMEDEVITDFEIAWHNAQAARYMGKPGRKLEGCRLLRDHLPAPDTALAVFTQIKAAFVSGMEQEDANFSPTLGHYITATRSRFREGVLNVIKDKRAMMRMVEKEKEQSGLLNGIIQYAPVGMVLYEAMRNASGKIVDFKSVLFNREVNRLTGYTDEERRTLPLSSLLKGSGVESNFGRYVETVETGRPFSMQYYFQRTKKWLSFTGVKLGDGFLSIINDLTEKKAHEQQIGQQSAFLNSILDASLNGIYVLEARRKHDATLDAFIFQTGNLRFEELTGKKVSDCIGRPLHEIFPLVDQGDFLPSLMKALDQGTPQRSEVYYDDSTRWFRYSIVPMQIDKVVVTFEEETEEKKARAIYEEHKTLLDNVLRYSPSGISVSEMIRDANGVIVDARTMLANEAACEYVGLPVEAYLNKTARELDPNIWDSPLQQMALHTLATGEPFHTQYYLEVADRWLELSVSKLDEDRLINVFTDITSTKQTQLEIERAAKTLQTVFDAAQVGMFTLSPVFTEDDQIVDFNFMLVNKALSGYVNDDYRKLPGTRMSLWFPTYLENGIFEMYRECWLSGEARREERHYHGDELEIFVDLQVMRVENELLVTFTDHTALKRAQFHLEKSVEELKRSNANLEEFAYAASHDMQEPIRKIHFFSNRIKEEYGSELSEMALRYFGRLEAATERMRNLIDDLLTYSHISRSFHTAWDEVDLNQKLRNVLDDLELRIEEKKAIIVSDRLPVVRGLRRQLQQLFLNLIGNALKYSKPDQRPEIRISCSPVQGRDTTLNLTADEMNKEFYELRFVDNGIGFEQKDAERIFNVFQRLHGSAEFRGTGIGLSIARKVAENHHGYITAEGDPGVGAVFTVYLPVEQ